jgi:predicted GNAT superfamily acetyltransferase
MGSLRVRPGTVEDLAAIWAINAEGQPGVSALTRDELDRVLCAPGHVVVACVPTASDGAERVVGYCVTYRSGEAYDGDEFIWFRGRYPAFLYVDQVAVAGTHRRAGVGGRLYAAVEATARELALPVVACEVNRVPPNPSSLAFHERMDFVVVGDLETGDGREVALLVKAVS